MDSSRPAAPAAPNGPVPAPLPATLAETYWQAAWRGIKGQCPRCGEAKLFAKWLKPVERCPACGQDWTHARADDIPAYVAILVVGHLLAPLIILLAGDLEMSAFATAAIILPLATVIIVGGLQPTKGAVIALQWWLGMMGFKRERRSAAE
ncbi:DUF983 domain-containing protein [Tsuneonella amylolytica]|uniref:DUF983 domain-containing protein n=1 Tax=Tsuneonella amylolytica TaxID=2338327 RepID=UPI000EA882CC|nr:DUF983 domain-containing protein [Tsuneonella amylolytica]